MSSISRISFPPPPAGNHRAYLRIIAARVSSVFFPVMAARDRLHGFTSGDQSSGIGVTSTRTPGHVRSITWGA